MKGDKTMNNKVKKIYKQLAKVEAIYTGGSIWVFVGTLKDGTHFMHDDNFDTRILNEYPDPNNEDVWYEEWQHEHLVKDLDTEKYGAAFQLALLQFIRENQPKEWDYFFNHIEETAKELLHRKGWR